MSDSKKLFTVSVDWPVDVIDKQTAERAGLLWYEGNEVGPLTHRTQAPNEQASGPMEALKQVLRRLHDQGVDLRQAAEVKVLDPTFTTPATPLSPDELAAAIDEITG